MKDILDTRDAKRSVPVILVLLGIVGMALALQGCGSDTTTGPSAIASPSPVPSPTPAPPDVLVSVDAYDANSRNLIFSADHDQEVVFKATVEAFDPVSHASVPAPFVQEHEWQSFSDPFVGCAFSGPVTTDHPHFKCRGDGYAIVRDTAFTYGNVVLGRSPLYSLPIGTAAGASAGWRRLDDAEAAAVLRKWGVK